MLWKLEYNCRYSILNKLEIKLAIYDVENVLKYSINAQVISGIACMKSKEYEKYCEACFGEEVGKCFDDIMEEINAIYTIYHDTSELLTTIIITSVLGSEDSDTEKLYKNIDKLMEAIMPINSKKYILIYPKVNTDNYTKTYRLKEYTIIE